RLGEDAAGGLPGCGRGLHLVRRPQPQERAPPARPGPGPAQERRRPGGAGGFQDGGRSQPRPPQGSRTPHRGLREAPRRQLTAPPPFGIISQSMKKLIRPLVEGLQAYVPGEQPKIPGLINLNTNENPYPPSPKVLRAVKAAVDGRLRLYPNPTAQALRERLAKLHRCRLENVIVGNGSDELLAMAVRAFVEPASGRVQWFSPSYSLYPVIAKQHGAKLGSAPLEADFSLPTI